MSVGKYAGPFVEQRDELVAELADAVPRLRAHRVQGVEVPELRGRRHLLRDVAALQTVDLVEGDHDRYVQREHALRDEAVAGADPVAAVDDEENGIDVLEGPRRPCSACAP